MNIVKKYDSQIEFVNNLEEEFLNSYENETVIVVLDQTEVICCNEHYCDLEWCKEHNLPVVKQDKLFLGNCTVGMKGNIIINAKRTKEIHHFMSYEFSKALAEYLIEKGLPGVSYFNNCVFVAGFKVASGSDAPWNEYQYTGYQISIYQDMDLFEGVLKNTVNPPLGLSDFDITTDEIIEFCMNYWSIN